MSRTDQSISEENTLMYRKRAREAHNLHPQPQAETNQPGAQGWNFQQPQQPSVQFFNPSQHQNGDLQPPPASLASSDTAVSKVNGSAPGEQSSGAEWSNENHQVTSSDQNHNNNSHYNYNYNTQHQTGGAEHQQDQYQSQSSQEPVYNSQQSYSEESHGQQASHYQPELTLDPSGQWYWDYQQQQWFPYYQPQTDNYHLQQQQQQQHEQFDNNRGVSPADVVDELAQDLSQQLTTADHPQPQEEVQAVETVEEAVQAVDNVEVEGGGHPLGPPDLVDHRPNSSQPELVSDLTSQQYHPPDLTSQPAPSLVSHDQHYEFYSQARSEALSTAQPSQGMPDVTGQPAGALVGEEEEAQLAPDILRTEPALAIPSTTTVPSSDRNLFMETGELAEEDVARAQDLGLGSLPPMVGGNEQSGPPLQRLVLGDSLAREVEGESEPVASVVRVVPGLAPPPAPAPAPPAAVELGETRSEAAGSDRRDVTVMGPAVSRAPPPPTPGRDIAGEESGPGHRQRDFESTDERERDTDSGDRYDTGRRRGGSPRRSYRSSTDREEERRMRNTRDRDHRSYYDRMEERRRREEEDDEDDRRSYREYRDYRDYRDRRDRRERYRVKKEPRDYDERYSVREYEEDGSSHRPSRPSSRAGSVSHYDPDRSIGGYNMSNMSNMSMSDPWAFMQHQMRPNPMMPNPLQMMMHNQMMALNPLQFQIQSAVAEMEKALDTPANVLIYKQYWDCYSKSPALMEKLKLEQPIQHHLIQHFRNNFWHLVENMERAKKVQQPEPSQEPVPASQVEERERVRPADSFSTQFHGGSGAEESSIRGELDSILGRSSGLTPSPVPPPPDRLTPLLFTRPHVSARMSAGLLVRIEPNNPQEGQAASVEVHSIEALLRNTADSQELAAFPGPLKPGVTHKNDVIKFCEKKIAAAETRRDIADKESYVLLWEMLVLLLRQKGQVEGSDLAELLLRRSSETSSHQDDSSATSLNNEELSETRESLLAGVNTGGGGPADVNKFRSYLLHGNKTEGLEYAMSVGLWGHALFLASKMDQRTYASVMTRFANGLVINDPLQTLYQLMSARVPGAMKQCGDRRWGDWRPHLAMILSNTLPGTDINRRSIITLGDTLLAKGQLYAAQFCYIVSVADWGTFSNKMAKLVLLLSSPADQSLEQFASIEAIQCTEIYEFVQKLGNKEYSMPFLQPYKYLHMTRLLEAGLTTRAQDYSRVLSQQLTHSLSSGEVIDQSTIPNWVNNTLYLADKLKYMDPVYTTSSGEMSDIGDPDWLGEFSTAVLSLSHQQFSSQADLGYSYNGEEAGHHDNYQEMAPAPAENYQDYSQQYQDQYQGYDPATAGQAQHFQPADPDYQEAEPVTEQTESVPVSGDPSASTPTFLNPAEMSAPPAVSVPPFFNPNTIPEPAAAPGGRKGSLSRQSSAQTRSRQASESKDTSGGYYNLGRTTVQPPPPQLPAQPPTLQPVQPPVESPAPAPAPAKQKEDTDKSKQTSGAPKKRSWFPNLFSKIIKNEAHLPDDNDKRIIYDEAKGRWVNLDEDEDTSGPAAPPPMDPSCVPGSAPGQNQPPTNFRAGLAGRRGGRGYVNVLGQSGMTKPVTAPMMQNGAPPLAPMDPLTMPSATPMVPSNQSTEESIPDSSGPPSMPLMFNPNSVSGSSLPPPSF